MEVSSTWRHARDKLYQAPPLFSCNVEKIGEAGDEAKAFICSTLGCRCPSPQACLLILKEGTTVERGPSDIGSDELVWKYLSKDMSIDRAKDDTLSMHVPKVFPTCCVPRPQKFAEKTFLALHKSVNFAKVFSLESFPLYGMQNMVVRYCNFAGAKFCRVASQSFRCIFFKFCLCLGNTICSGNYRLLTGT